MSGQRAAVPHRFAGICSLSLLPAWVPRLWLALCALATPAAAADNITIRAEVFGPLGVHLSTVRTEIDEFGNRYAISVDYATTGVARLLLNETSHAEARGWLSLDSARPESFRRDTRTNEVERHNIVRYHDDGTVEGGSTPAPPNPVNLAAADGTVDDVTAYFRLERQLAAKGSCVLTVPVFDGRHRYDFVFADAGRHELSLHGGKRLQTIACHMKRRDLAVPAGESDEGAREGTIWCAPLLPNGVWVPLRMELETAIGTTVANLAELKAPGLDWRL